jgi:N-acetylated-alpha-linked acidic dipeptidase
LFKILKVVEEDWSALGKPTIPTYHAYSSGGNVTAQVVYANYGSSEDFATLKSLGVDVRGKIVLIRYGQTFRKIPLSHPSSPSPS